MKPTMRILQAMPEHLEVILKLVDEARGWLPTKDTDQWSKPWPDEKGRNDRIRAGLIRGQTWIVWDGRDGTIPAATITAVEKPDTTVWPESACDLSESAVYAHRLIVARKYAGCGLGAELLDWAGRRGERNYDAKWIRIDVWTNNHLLHKYYETLGFVRCGTCPNSKYPSGALFQRPVLKTVQETDLQFEELSASFGVPFAPGQLQTVAPDQLQTAYCFASP